MKYENKGVGGNDFRTEVTNLYNKMLELWKMCDNFQRNLATAGQAGPWKIWYPVAKQQSLYPFTTLIAVGPWLRLQLLDGLTWRGTQLLGSSQTPPWSSVQSTAKEVHTESRWFLVEFQYVCLLFRARRVPRTICCSCICRFLGLQCTPNVKTWRQRHFDVWAGVRSCVDQYDFGQHNGDRHRQANARVYTESEPNGYQWQEGSETWRWTRRVLLTWRSRQ